MPGRGRYTLPPALPEQLKEWRLVPGFHIAGLIVSALMMLYPFYLLYWVGESQVLTGVRACVLIYGNWRILHVSHLLLWAIILTIFALTFPIALVRDEEECVYVYVLTAGSIPIPFRHVQEVRVMKNFCGYVQLVTTAIPIIMKPEIGAERFVSDYMSFHHPATYGATGEEKKQPASSAPGAASPGNTETELAEGMERGAKAAGGAAGGAAAAAGAGAAGPPAKESTPEASQSAAAGGERGGGAEPAPETAAAAEGAPAA